MKSSSILVAFAACLSNFGALAKYHPSSSIAEPSKTMSIYPVNTTVPIPGNTDVYITRTQTIVYPHPTIPGSLVTRTITYTLPGGPSHNNTGIIPPPHPKPTGGAHPGHPNGTCIGCFDDGKNKRHHGRSNDRMPPALQAKDALPDSAAAINTVTGLIAISILAAAHLV